MIVYKDKKFIANSEYPDTDWVGDADYVIPDESELAEKIKGAYPYFELVFGDDGNIVDIEETERPPVPPEPPTNAELAAAIAELAEVICGG